ncbi:hypothetical protein L3Q82_001203 [Scortum barcoo]|uniref:Uncharacterized protein n=1 Tax=Scortum barcoo TaxID=214431 RepID=A0ACB8W7H5_9TELE|nr:hypothetical protein L3Q82_001203 [Scortum barcoo]
MSGGGGAESNILERPPHVDRVRSQLTPHCCHRTLSLPGSPRVPAATLPHQRGGGDPPSAHALARRCRKIWAAARRMLLQEQAWMKTAADHHRHPVPVYTPGQKVWLSTKDLPLHVDTRKLAPRFVGHFPVSKVINPVSVQLKLPRSLRVDPTFHISKLKPVWESPLVPPTKPPPKMVDGGCGGPVQGEKAAGSA